MYCQACSASWDDWTSDKVVTDSADKATLQGTINTAKTASDLSGTAAGEKLTALNTAI